MKGFEFELPRILKTAEVLSYLMEGETTTPLVRFDGIQYIVVPKVAKFFDYFRNPLSKTLNKPLRRVKITFKDFSTYKIVKVDKAHISIFLNLKGTSEWTRNPQVELYIDSDNSSQLFGELGRYPFDRLCQSYQFLIDNLPFNIGESTLNQVNFAMHSYRVIASSIATMTTLYNLSNFKDRIKVHNVDGKGLAYLDQLVKRIAEFGNDFAEILENMGALSLIL
jgi:hypothetical protein